MWKCETQYSAKKISPIKIRDTLHTSRTPLHMTVRDALLDVRLLISISHSIILIKESIGGQPSFNQERKWKSVAGRVKAEFQNYGESDHCKFGEMYVSEWNADF